MAIANVHTKGGLQNTIPQGLEPRIALSKLACNCFSPHPHSVVARSTVEDQLRVLGRDPDARKDSSLRVPWRKTARHGAFTVN
jgi:hypothetical protein